MDLFILVLPLILIIGLLVLRQHMLVAALAGGIAAMIIGKINVGSATGIFLKGVGQMMGITVPILYAAAAGMVAKAGCFKAIVDLAKYYLKGKLAPLAAFMVLVQGLATYMAGMGAGNTMVIAPLVAAAVGAVPQVVAGMAIIAAVGFTTSPASTETVIAAQMAGRDVMEHAAAMLPYTALFYILAAALAFWGVAKHGSFFVKNGDEAKDEAAPDIATSWRMALPALVLLVFVVAGGYLNKLFGHALFTPMAAICVAGILTVVCTKLNSTQTCDALVEGSRFILMTLLAVGIFLGFINMIGEIGTFKALAELANKAPKSLTLPAAMIIGFVVAFPAGAFCAGVLTLVLPTLASLNMPSEAMGFVAIATGLGTQISPVQINVAALGEGFGLPIMKVIRCNLPFVIPALVLLIIVAVAVV